MEQWVKDWVKKQRESGEIGIEIKKQANSYYVYRSTTYWDKKAKKRRKKSTYIGKLSRDGLREKKEKRVTVKQYGNAVLLQEAMKDIVTSLKVFESWGTTRTRYTSPRSTLHYYTPRMVYRR